MPSGAVINSVEDFIAAAVQIFDAAQRELVFIVPHSVQSLAGTDDATTRAKRFIENGGVVRGIIAISAANREEVRKRADVGAELRHHDEVHELFISVVDKRYSVSSVNMGVEEFTHDTPIVAFWSDDPTYAEYLLALFANVWSQAIPAETRFEELSEED